MEFSFNDATIFKFNRTERRWREKGYGTVYFFRQGDDLIISLGKQRFFLNDGIRPKGLDSFVMRVRKGGSNWNKPDIILAIRLGRAGDSKRMFGLLADRIVDSHPRLKVSKKSHKSRKQPPQWFSSLGRHQKLTIRSFIASAGRKNLNDGSLQRQLAKACRLSPWQIEEAIEFFHRQRGSRRKKYSLAREASYSFDNSASSIPPLSPSMKIRRKTSKVVWSPDIGYRRYSANSPYKKLVVNGRPNTSRQFSPVRFHFSPSGDRESNSETSAQLIRSSGLNTPVLRRPESSPNPNRQLDEGQILKKLKETSIHANVRNIPQLIETGNPGATPGKFIRVTTRGDGGQISRVTARGEIGNFRGVTPLGDLGNFSAENFRQAALLNIEGQKRSNFQGEQTSETLGRDISFQITPLTEKNLTLLNKITPPLKGDYTTIVSTWLEKSVEV